MTSNLSRVFLVSLILVIGVFPYSARGAKKLPALGVYVSSDKLVQADTLLVAVKNRQDAVTGNLGSVTLHFFRSENNKDWVALVGIPVDKKPGNYILSITAKDKAPFKKDITVSKRNFPITSFIVTPPLLKKGYTVKKIVTTIQHKENTALNKVLGRLTPIVYFTKPFSYPLDHITVVGTFGDIRATKIYKIQHLGVDLKAPLHTPVYAVNDGTVVFEEKMPDYGNTLIINHGLGIYSLYLHLSEFKAKKGHLVKQAQLVGLSGDTGYVMGPHLHFSIKMRGAALDPLKFIKATKKNW